MQSAQLLDQLDRCAAFVAKGTATPASKSTVSTIKHAITSAMSKKKTVKSDKFNVAMMPPPPAPPPPTAAAAVMIMPSPPPHSVFVNGIPMGAHVAMVPGVAPHHVLPVGDSWSASITMNANAANVVAIPSSTNSTLQQFMSAHISAGSSHAALHKQQRQLLQDSSDETAVNDDIDRVLAMCVVIFCVFANYAFCRRIGEVHSLISQLLVEAGLDDAYLQQTEMQNDALCEFAPIFIDIKICQTWTKMGVRRQNGSMPAPIVELAFQSSIQCSLMMKASTRLRSNQCNSVSVLTLSIVSDYF
jgi:hypothetical protein